MSSKITSSMSQGEARHPTPSLAAVGLLFFRFRNNPEILVRYDPEETNPMLCTPYRTPRQGEAAIDTAIRVGRSCVLVEIPEEDLDYEDSGVLSNPADSVKIRVFPLRATYQVEEVPRYDNWRQWKYKWGSHVLLLSKSTMAKTSTLTPTSEEATHILLVRETLDMLCVGATVAVRSAVTGLPELSSIEDDVAQEFAKERVQRWYFFHVIDTGHF
ncbi:hypothetical protein F4802DRAFT_593587 [Xylaria palmicola]|nr:hypothetical protein F4802DRAFT_593587 [Xylaria palmicola]